MIRLNRLTDYGIVVLAHMAQGPERRVYSARELARESGVPLPTVSKLLKTLCRADLVTSQRGLNGGYALARDPKAISMTRVISALEGPVAVTECSGEHSTCAIQDRCVVRGRWQGVSDAIRRVLDGVSLLEMAGRKPERGSSAGRDAR